MDRTEDYEKYMKEKGVSAGTLSAYVSDVRDFISYLDSIMLPAENASQEDFENYLSKLDSEGKSKATVNRRISSVRSFYDYLIETGAAEANPCSKSKAQKLEEKEIVYLTEEEITKLVESPGNDAMGLRDRALLEMMYATGVRVTELCDLDIADINLKVGYISVNSKDRNKGRAVPMGRYCREAVREYMLKSRRTFLKNKEDKGALFLNYQGERMTRQGVWKVLKSCAEKCGIDKEVTPQVIRNTFAVHLIQHGADLRSLQELMGHEDIMATKIYLKFKKYRIMDVYNSAFPRA